jgi:hypothetical protein
MEVVVKSDRIVDAELIKQVQAELYPLGRVEVAKRLEALEPDLSCAITRAAVIAVGQLEEDAEVDDVASSNVFDAVEWSALIAVEVLRRAFYALWRETVMGTRLAQLDPSLTGDQAVNRNQRPRTKERKRER